MTIQEKLAAMEALWEDLSRSPEAIESPKWHREILDERRQRVADGTAQFEDWETAKANPREASLKIEILDEVEADLIEGFHFYEHRETGLGWYFYEDHRGEIDLLVARQMARAFTSFRHEFDCR